MKNYFTVIQFLVPILMLGLALAGCLKQAVSNQAGRDDFGVVVGTSTNCLSANERITFRATVTNHGTSSHSIELKDKPVFDLSLYYRNPKDTVIKWSDGKPLDSSLTSFVLAPGESKTIEMTWTVIAGIRAVTATASFIDEPNFENEPIAPAVVVPVGACPGFGP